MSTTPHQHTIQPNNYITNYIVNTYRQKDEKKHYAMQFNKYSKTIDDKHYIRSHNHPNNNLQSHMENKI